MSGSTEPAALDFVSPKSVGRYVSRTGGGAATTQPGGSRRASARGSTGTHGAGPMETEHEDRSPSPEQPQQVRSGNQAAVPRQRRNVRRDDGRDRPAAAQRPRFPVRPAQEGPGTPRAPERWIAYAEKVERLQSNLGEQDIDLKGLAEKRLRVLASIRKH